MSTIIELNEKRNQALQSAFGLRNQVVEEARVQGWEFFCLHATNTTSEDDYDRVFYFHPSHSDTLSRFGAQSFYYDWKGPRRGLARFLAWLKALAPDQYVEIL